MNRVFNIALLVVSISLACSQSVSALYLGHSTPTLEIAIEYGLEEFNQQANFQKSATERIDRKGHTLNMFAQKGPIDKAPLPVPKPRPAPIVPRF